MHQHEEARDYADCGAGYRLFSVVFFELWVPAQERCLIHKSGVIVKGGDCTSGCWEDLEQWAQWEPDAARLAGEENARQGASPAQRSLFAANRWQIGRTVAAASASMNRCSRRDV